MASRALAIGFAKFALRRVQSVPSHRCMSAIPQPAPDNSNKQYPEKISNIVSEISKLTLIEVADLNELLKRTLNIQEAAVVAAAAPAASAPVEEEDEPQVQKIQTSFAVKLTKFDETKKINLIKELKNLMEGTNLVQAKKFVEGAPQIIKADLTREEAEALQKSVEAAGGTCEIV
ncbi:39S ribosomal protein L12, mitochondrial [Galendromus occidentalis]|uniref:39S ribosomal protein L12, mitochondrial n=1 Tax=Galendromus occidentalis TaxID=34638 RepID=A0AAJ6QU85_9ACAR|nr:39S ribosomal protein L12, mitochondrial [Galendromus occidentalis]